MAAILNFDLTGFRKPHLEVSSSECRFYQIFFQSHGNYLKFKNMMWCYHKLLLIFSAFCKLYSMSNSSRIVSEYKGHDCSAPQSDCKTNRWYFLFRNSFKYLNVKLVWRVYTKKKLKTQIIKATIKKKRLSYWTRNHVVVP